MKRNRLLAFGLLFSATLVVFGQLPPSTLPPKPERIPLVKAPGNLEGAEFRRFRIAGKDYCAVLNHQAITSGPEWSTSSALPQSLGEIEATARAELNKLVSDAPEWEVTNIQLSRFSREESGKKWYYVVSFNPMLQLRGVAPDNIVVMLTIDGKAGRVSRLQTSR
jgi:hypothetical protein